MASPFSSENAPNGVDAPASDAIIVTKSDTVDMPSPARGFYAVAAGVVSVITAAGATRAIPVAAFQIIPLGITRVRNTGTTVTGDIVALIK